MTTFLIYKLCSPSGKSYIGFTSTSLDKRWKRHQYNWRYARDRKISAVNEKLGHALDKYPPENWTTEVLYEGDDKEHALIMEMILIEQYNCVERGYNIQIGGGRTSLGLKLSETHKQRISAAKRGKPQTEKAKQASSESHKGLKQSAETIEKRVSKIRGRPSKLRGRTWKKQAKVINDYKED